jgi:hypothetical protein
MNHFSKDQRDYGRFRESDSYDDFYDDMDTDGSFTNSNFRFDDEEFGRRRERRPYYGRFPGINRFGEQRIRHDPYQDNPYDPYYEDEFGMKHPYEHGGRYNRWSDDIRSEASRENHFGKGPKGYKRSPERIIDEACEILERDFQIDASDVEVDYKDGTLILKGEVSSRSDKRRAESLVENLAGVEDVHNNLRIKKSHVEGWIPGLGNIENEF